MAVRVGRIVPSIRLGLYCIVGLGLDIMFSHSVTYFDEERPHQCNVLVSWSNTLFSCLQACISVG